MSWRCHLCGIEHADVPLCFTIKVGWRARVLERVLPLAMLVDDVYNAIVPSRRPGKTSEAVMPATLFVDDFTRERPCIYC